MTTDIYTSLSLHLFSSYLSPGACCGHLCPCPPPTTFTLSATADVVHVVSCDRRRCRWMRVSGERVGPTVMSREDPSSSTRQKHHIFTCFVALLFIFADILVEILSAIDRVPTGRKGTDAFAGSDPRTSCWVS